MAFSKIIAGALLGILLVFTLFGFVLSYSMHEVFDENVVMNTVEKIVDVKVDLLIEKQFSDEEMPDIYSEISAECDSLEVVDFSYNEYSLGMINCSEVLNAGESELKNYLKTNIKENIRAELPRKELKNLLRVIWWMAIIFGVVSTILIVTIVFVTHGHSLLILGASGLMAGFPATYVGVMRVLIESKLRGLVPEAIGIEFVPESILNLIGLLTQQLFILLFSLMIGGLFLFVLGFFVSIIFVKRKRWHRRRMKFS